MGIAVPLKILTLFLILSGALPTPTSKHGSSKFLMTKAERETYAPLTWSYTLFYPFWGPYLTTLTTSRVSEKNFKRFQMKSERQELCEASNWTEYEDCAMYTKLVGGIAEFKDEYIGAVKKLWEKFPNQVCKSVGWVQDQTQFLVDDIVANPDSKVLVFYEIETSLYMKHFEEILRPLYKGKKCYRAARYHLNQLYKIARLNGNIYYDNEMNTFFKSYCLSYQSRCTNRWSLKYGVPYQRGDEKIISLTKELCERNSRFTFCKYPSGLSDEEDYDWWQKNFWKADTWEKK
jgi:hypothetical protein